MRDGNIAALESVYRVTISIVGSAVATAALGVRQASSTSCFLFVIFVNELIKIMNERKVQPRNIFRIVTYNGTNG